MRGGERRRRRVWKIRGGELRGRFSVESGWFLVSHTLRRLRSGGHRCPTCTRTLVHPTLARPML
jgi:hypothetical protein